MALGVGQTITYTHCSLWPTQVNLQLTEARIPHPSDPSSARTSLRPLSFSLYLSTTRLLTVYFGTPNMFITLWYELDYGTNPPLGTLMI
jgi:hypothetical protein